MMKSNWYVLHTYSGYENKVKDSLEKLIESNELHESIFHIVVPTEEIIEKNDNKIKKTVRKIYPGYVFVKMIMNDDTWYRVRNIRGVTGFVGPTGKEAVPLNDDEVLSMGIKEPTQDFNYQLNETIIIKVGALKGQYATIQEINMEKRRIKALVNIMGESIIDVDFAHIEKIE